MPVIVSQHITHAQPWLEWRINRPERLNALGTTIAQELLDCLDQYRKFPPGSFRAIVITAETVRRPQEDIWIAGGDLKELAQLSFKEEGQRYGKSMRMFCEGLTRVDCPVVTAVDGLAIGGGAELSLYGDLRLATKSSKFSFKQLQIGLTTGYGSAKRLVELVGLAHAQRILFFCEELHFNEALSLGLIHRSLPDQPTPQSIGQAILPILQLEPCVLATQKKMLHLATTQAGDNQGWADDLFKSVWLNETHKRSLDRFRK